MVGVLAPTTEAFSPLLGLRSPVVSARPEQRLGSCAARAPRLHGSQVATIRMAGAGGKAVTLDSDGFDTGDADPIGSMEALNKVRHHEREAAPRTDSSL